MRPPTGPDHPDVARDLNNLALILQDLGQAGQARPLQERALAIDEAAYGPDHPAVATDLNNLAQILRDLGQPGQARPLQERALAITEAAYGPGPPRRRHRPEQPRPDPAGPRTGRAGTGSAGTGPSHRRGLLRPGHPAVATDLNNLAQILRDLGQPGQARPLQERALAITEAARSGLPDEEAGALRI